MRGERKTRPQIKRFEIDRDIKDGFIKFEKISKMVVLEINKINQQKHLTLFN